MYQTIHPYRIDNCWVFDDPAKGLEEEGLVDGIDVMLDHVCEELGVDPKKGLDVHFASDPEAFEGTPHSVIIHLKLQHECQGGWLVAGAMYKNVGTGQEGWLCPNLSKYFQTLPQDIFIAHSE